MRARCSTLACLAACSLFLVCSAFGGQLAANCYSGTTAQSPIKQGAKAVTFDLKGFTGTIGNATFTSETVTFTLSSGQDGDRLNDIAYTATGGTIVICEVR